jgi:formate dehydrogenase iron-sulfur subunit
MYVLHHADKPHIYASLPDNPRISPLVKAWKGAGKYAGMGIIALSVVAGALHYLMQGPNRVTKKDEEEAERLAEEKT